MLEFSTVFVAHSTACGWDQEWSLLLLTGEKKVVNGRSPGQNKANTAFHVGMWAIGVGGTCRNE